MKKIKDERLLMENLKSIRFAFLFQTIGIIGILAYHVVKNGVTDLLTNPLWILLLGTAMILGFFQLKNSVDMENKKNPWSLYQKGLLSAIIGTVCGLIVLFSPGVSNQDAVLIGVVLFLSFFFTFSVTHYLRANRDKE